MYMKVNKIIYIVLAIFFGGLGLHKFYAKNNGRGILYLLFFWTGIPEILGIIEGILTIFKPSDEEGNIIK